MPNQTVLPLPLSSFVGREREIAELTRLFAVTRLMTLSGPGGCGKTRLALELARAMQDQYPDGVWLVELAPLGDPELLPQAVAGTLGIEEQPGLPLRETLVEQVRPRATLLILDNCEHLVLACARLAEALLSACPNLRILATSREPLDIPGEISWLVPSLSLPDGKSLPGSAGEAEQSEAVRLFVERATSVSPGFVLHNEEAAQVAQICIGLDGIPLAIELAAARVRALPVADIALRLKDSLRFLSSGSRTAPPRQQSLRAVLDWSYALLSPHEQGLLARLSVFPDGFTLDALETICLEPAGDVECRDRALDLLTNLVSKSLVTASSKAGAPGRYRLLEVVRQYAWARLLDLPEEEVTRLQEACLHFYLELSRAAEPGLRGEAQLSWLARLQAELANVRAAMQWGLEHGRSSQVMELAANLWRFWYMRGLLSEGRRWLATAGEARTNAELASDLRAWATNAAAVMACYQADYEQAARLARAGLELHLSPRRADQGAVLALTVLGQASRAAGDFALARRQLEDALDLARSTSRPWDAASVLFLQGTTAIMTRDPTMAEVLLKQSLSQFRTLGDMQGVADAGGLLGLAAQMRGDYQTARAAYREALAVFRAMEGKRKVAELLLALAVTEILASDFATAQGALEESTALFVEIGQPYYLAISLLAWGSLAVARGHANGAARATRLFGAAEAVREAIQAPLPPAYQAVAEPFVAMARVHLGAAAFADHWVAGRGMKLDEAVACAVDETACETAELPARAAEPLAAATAPSARVTPAPTHLTTLQAAKAQFAGLTGREREVAALVAEGLTNQDIAGRLVISERTAATHVGNILSKLEFSSRAQIAAWAVTRGLATPPSAAS